MIIMVACFACKHRTKDISWRTAKQRQRAEVVCRTCGGTERISVEETLPCSKCRLNGQLESLLVYQDTIGRLMVWRCSLGHALTELVVP
jgi:DnaJ-class molecular chaperone